MNGSNALIGSGRVAFTSDPSLPTPLVGTHVLGSKPWFCIKKMMRFGVELPAADGPPVAPNR